MPLQILEHSIVCAAIIQQNSSAFICDGTTKERAKGSIKSQFCNIYLLYKRLPILSSIKKKMCGFKWFYYIYLLILENVYFGQRSMKYGAEHRVRHCADLFVCIYLNLSF